MSGTESFTLRLIAAVDAAWSAVRGRNPDVPEVVFTLGAGSSARRGAGLKYGHFHDGTWQRGEATLPELFIGGEGLERGPVELLGTLLHEAGHGVASTRGIQDTSRQGRYHNDRFRLLAGELGITVTKDERAGWSPTAVPAATIAAYRPQVEALGSALTAFRRPAVRSRADSNNGVSASCGCGRRIRVAAAVLDQAPITCGACGEEFR
ncbi:MAG TPA: hypothetical protein VGG75_14765 [Trebonia sp.]|jgi:hypothetical protein